jgi:hypothetical protein
MTRARRNRTRRRRAIAWLATRVRRSSNHKNHVGLTRVRRRGKFRFGPDRGGGMERTAVVTVTLAVMGFVPSGVTVDGDAEQVAPRGAPPQPSVTLALNPKDGVTVKV